jgi:hypothetical protein
MRDLVSRCNNFYEMRNTEMEFAVKFSSNHEIFTLHDLSVHNVHSPVTS